MAISILHGPYAVDIGGTTLGGVLNAGLEMGLSVNGEPVSDEVYSRRQSMVAERNRATFSSNNVAAALALCGVIGLDLSASNLSMYAQQRDCGGARASGASHRKYLFDKGMLIPKTLSCAFGEDAVITYEAIAISNAGAVPITLTEAASLPTAPTDAERFTIGPTTSHDIAGVNHSCIRSLEIDFGIDFREEGADSDTYATFGWIASIQPVITLRGVKLDWLGASGIGIGVGGVACTHANTNLYLQKRAEGGAGGMVAVATAQHIKITAAGLAVIGTAFDGASGGVAEASLTLHTKYDGTDTPVKIATASAIS